MRAKLPSKDGYVERDGVRIFYEVYGDGPQTMVFAVETFCPAKDGYSAARIEEMVVLTPDGAKIISLYPAKELPVANKY